METKSKAKLLKNAGFEQVKLNGIKRTVTFQHPKDTVKDTKLERINTYKNEELIASELGIYKNLPTHKHLPLLRTNRYEIVNLPQFGEYDLDQLLSSPNKLIFWVILDNSVKLSMIVNWMVCITSALESLHQNDIIHGNLTPDSIILKVESNWVSPIICDFQMSNTSSMKICYRDPEQCQDFKSSKNTDIFSLGRIFLEFSFLLAGLNRSEISKMLDGKGYSHGTSTVTLDKLFGLLPTDRKLIPKLLDLIKGMTQECVLDRPTAVEVLQCLNSIIQELDIKMECRHEDT